MGTDGASANIAGRGLKGLMERKLPWLYWRWSIAHRLELAVKDALKGTAFEDIEEMLLRLYYINENSPKKCRELKGNKTSFFYLCKVCYMIIMYLENNFKFLI